MTADVQLRSLGGRHDLRVTGAGVSQLIISANTSSLTLMIAEKAAEWIQPRPQVAAWPANQFAAPTLTHLLLLPVMAHLNMGAPCTLKAVINHWAGPVVWRSSVAKP